MSSTLDPQTMLDWLREDQPRRLEELWRHADQVRREQVGDAVHLRGLIEISNHCVRQCAYCGLRAGNRKLERYRLSADEILQCAHQALQAGYGTVVLQGGEDPGLTLGGLSDVVRRIKTETGLAVTLSLGERTADELRAWRAAGADRYLLRFETSDRALYDFIHPGRGGLPSDRLALLRTLRDLGYEVGSGIMVGLPGQKFASVVQDLRLFRELDLDMIGLGPFLPHPATPLRRGPWGQLLAPAGQVPNTELMVHKVLALTRLLCPQANLPSTTALATLNPRSGHELGLQRGANVVMLNLTPPRYRPLYEIYPAKAGVDASDAAHHARLLARLQAIGRGVGQGPGARLNHRPGAVKSPFLPPLPPQPDPTCTASMEIKICMGSACFARGNRRNLDVIQAFLARQRLPATVDVVGHLCAGRCQDGPNLMINGEVHHDVDPAHVLGVLNRWVVEATE